MVALIAACDAPFEGAESEAIVNGTAMPAGKYRWMASLRDLADQHACGGALIARQWVLTAGHCIRSNLHSVVIGGVDRTNPNDGQRFGIAATIVHPSFSLNGGAPLDDVALVELDGIAEAPALALNDDAGFPGAVDLAAADETTENVVSMGWGQTSFANEVLPALLQEAELPVVTNTSCAAATQLSPTADELCAGFAAITRGDCFGDSGSPLIAYAYGAPVEAGIASYGRAGKCGSPGFPTVFARVSSFVPWIRAQGVSVTLKSDLDVAAAPASVVAVNRVSNHVAAQHLVVQDAQQLLRHYVWSGAWSIESLPLNAKATYGAPAMVTGPSATAYNIPTLHVFTRALATGHLFHAVRSDPGGWAAEDLTAKGVLTIAGDPVAIDGPQLGTSFEGQNVFARGTAGGLVHYGWIDGQWRAEDLSANAPATARPAGDPAVANGPGVGGAGIRAQNVFVRGSQGDLIRYNWVNFPGWTIGSLTKQTGLKIAGDPIVLNGLNTDANGQRSQGVFALAADGSLLHFYGTQDLASWGGENLTTKTGAGAAGRLVGRPAVLNGGGLGNGDVPAQHVFGRNASGHLIHYGWVNYAGWQWEDMTANYGGLTIAGDPVAMLASATDTGIAGIDLFAEAPGGDLVHYAWFVHPGWHSEDLSRQVGGSVLPALAALTGPQLGPGGIAFDHVFSDPGGGIPTEYLWINVGGWIMEVLP